MGSIDIECRKNITFSFKCREGIEKENIKIGAEGCIKYWSYLYFDIGEKLENKKIIEAKIVLYKTPNKYGKFESEYYIAPVKEFVSKYSYHYTNTIKIDDNLGNEFITNENLAYEEIYITNIIEEIVKGKLENKGFILLGNERSKYIEFMGNQKESMDKPFLRVKYEGGSYIDGTNVNLPVKIKIKES